MTAKELPKSFACRRLRRAQPETLKDACIERPRRVAHCLKQQKRLQRNQHSVPKVETAKRTGLHRSQHSHKHERDGPNGDHAQLLGSCKDASLDKAPAVRRQSGIKLLRTINSSVSLAPFCERGPLGVPCFSEKDDCETICETKG